MDYSFQLEKTKLQEIVMDNKNSPRFSKRIRGDIVAEESAEITTDLKRNRPSLAQFLDDDDDLDFGSQESSSSEEEMTNTRNRKGKHHALSWNECVQSQKECLFNLSGHIDILKPFISQKVVNELKAVHVKVLANSKGLTKAEKPPPRLLPQPKSIASTCSMRSYQLEGFSWLAENYSKSINCILADEVGPHISLLIVHVSKYSTLRISFLSIYPYRVRQRGHVQPIDGLR